MAPKFNYNVEKEPYNEGPFLMRALNESTDCSFTLRPQELFRPTLTVYHSDDLQTNKVANELARYVESLNEEHVDQMTLESVVALLSTMLPIQRKAPLINMALRWIQKRTLDAADLNALLQSIVVKNLNFDQVAVIRLALHSYLNNSELRDYFDIYLNTNGFVNLKRKKQLAPGIWDKADELSYNTIIHKVKTKYENPFFNRNKTLSWGKPEKKNKSTKGFEYQLCHKKLDDPHLHLEYDRLKNKEDGKQPQIGFNSYFQNHKSNFGMCSPPNSVKYEQNSWNNQKNYLQKSSRPPFTWNNYNNDRNRTKQYNRRSHIGTETVRAVGFPPLNSGNGHVSETESDTSSVSTRDLTISKFCKQAAERIEEKKKFQPSPSEKNLFRLIENGEFSEEERAAAKTIKSRKNHGFFEDSSSSGFCSSNPSSSSLSSHSSSTSSFQQFGAHNVTTKISPKNQWNWPKIPVVNDQLTAHLDSLMLN